MPLWSAGENIAELNPLARARHLGSGPYVTHTLKRNKWRPVEEYLREQGRFGHLFEPVKQDDVIRTIQTAVDDYWNRVNEGTLCQLGQSELSCDSRNFQRAGTHSTKRARQYSPSARIACGNEVDGLAC